MARAEECLRGKQPKLSPHQEAHLVELFRAGLIVAGFTLISGKHGVTPNDPDHA